MPNPNPRYCVDGHEFNNVDSEMAGDGQFAPFRVFDTKAQDYLPGTYATRVDAERAIPATSAVWNDDDSARASAEGWNVFEVHGGSDDGYYMIEREDIAAAFANDDRAIAHVEREASHGSELHCKAMTLHRTKHGLGKN